MKHAATPNVGREQITAKLAFIGWADGDPRWKALEHFLNRVRDAGLSLVSQRDRSRLVERHLIPSLEALPFLSESANILDVGSGAGFPAIPLALSRLDCRFAAVESNERKSEFLARVSRETGLLNAMVIRSRVQDLGDEHLGRYDIVTARALTRMGELVEWTSPFLRAGGKWVLWKGQRWRDEADLAAMGVRLVEERTLSDGGRLVVLERSEGA